MASTSILINYSGSTDQLLETLATGKADAAVGMALRWLKPLEQGFDVKIVASTHGGCLRLLAPTSSDIKTLTDLKGKIIAVSDMNSPGKNFFSIRLKKAGLDPNADVEFKQFPGPLLRVSVEKGEAHALADNDPITFLFQKDGKLPRDFEQSRGRIRPSRLLHHRRARQPDPRRQADGGGHRAFVDRSLGIRRA